MMADHVHVLTRQELDHSLTQLQGLLLGLPSTIPEGSTYYNFHRYAPSENSVEDCGADGALNHDLEITFVPGSRQSGVIEFKECGPGLVAVVDVLRRFTCEYPANTVLQKWILDLTAAARNAGAV